MSNNYVRLTGHNFSRISLYLRTAKPVRLEWFIWQHGWSIRIHRTKLSVARRHRGAKFHYEHYEHDKNRGYFDDGTLQGYHYYNIAWSNPTEHKWWARSITLYLKM